MLAHKRLLESFGKPLAQFSLALIAVAGLLSGQRASAAPFVLTDSDFVSGVYEISYGPVGDSIFKNNVKIAGNFASLFVTNDAWVLDRLAWSGGGAFLSAPSNHPTFGVGTLGWDLSAVSGQIVRVELVELNHWLYQFSPWNDEALGDSIFGDVATPSAFGGGPYTNLYTLTSNNPTGTGPSEIGVSGLDLTPFLGSAWLANPGLLELRFGYSLLDTNIPDSHLELFRNDACCGGGFALRITRMPEPSLAGLLGWGGLLLLAGRAVRFARGRDGARSEPAAVSSRGAAARLGETSGGKRKLGD